jgi:oxaloacetate decarboxylase gamma subunit
MTIIEMLGQSGVLTVLGMAVVFSFLLIMIVCVTISGKVIHTLGLDKDASQPASQSAAAGPAKAASGRPGVVAAITAAVAEYRKTET